MKINFKNPLVGISDPGMLFSHFSSRPLVIFYFSTKCPLCEQYYPVVQKLIKEFEGKGLTGLAISAGSMTKNDIRSFMEQYSASIPFFQDASRQFGQ
ncbi:MAG: peroxiredoxin family protein, partial [Selenomonadaceae bacterium]